MEHMQRITPCLWLGEQAEEAAEFYADIFPDAWIVQVLRYPAHEVRGQRAGVTTTVAFELDKQSFTAIRSEARLPFNKAISFQITCRSQEEVDYYREKLGGGEQDRCGWFTDRYGLFWQIELSVD